MSDWGSGTPGDFTAHILAEGAFARRLAGIPELAHIPTYNLAAVPELRRQLGESLDLGELARRAADPNSPPAALIFLAGICPAAFCANPALPLLLLEDPALPARFEPASLGRLLSYAGVPAELLAAVAQLGQPEFAQAARLHVGLAGEAGPGWRAELGRAIDAMPTVPADDLLPLLLALGLVPAWLHSRAAAGAMSRREARPPAGERAAAPEREALAGMLDSADAAERARAAADQRVPPARLAEAKLREDWNDSDPAIYEALAGNPSSPAELLLALASDFSALNTRARRAVAHNPSAPAAALERLADEPFALDIPLALATHPNTGAAQRERMAAAALERAWHSEDPFYRAIAIAQPGADAERLAAAIRSPYWVERLAVALNPSTPAAARAALAEDGIRPVRAAARAGR
jgi:hypothetical protein